MSELTTTSILSLFETTKEQRESFSLDLIERIELGQVDPLKVHLQVKCMEDVVKLINANTVYKKAVLQSAENQGQKSFQFHNAKFEIKEVGTKYDYSKCEDPVLNDLSAELEALEKKLKDRQKFLQSIPQSGLTQVLESGEVITVYPPSKSSTTSVAVTLK